MSERAVTPDAAQQEAAMWHRGPCAVIAGPGSGKTAVITGRVFRLVRTYHAEAARILTITFTKAAAAEMQRRFLASADGDMRAALFGTFHSVLYRILTEGEGGSTRRFASYRDLSGIMEQVLKSFSMRFGTETVRTLLRTLSACKNRFVPGRPLPAVPPEVPYAASFPEIFAAFEELRHTLGLTGFDDIAPECYRMLKENPAIREHWQKRFSFLQVDEFQDVNVIQYEVLRLLANGEANLFVVGDDDQAIYGFRGADSGMMNRFLTDYPQAATRLLSVNYRADRLLIGHASRLMAQASRRKNKEVRPSPHAKEGAVLEHVYPERRQECAGIVKQIGDARANGEDLAAQAVLCRDGAACLRMAQALAEAGIPVLLREKIRIPFTERPAADVLAYLRFARTGSRRDFLRLLNAPLRYLSRECARTDPVRREEVKRYYGENAVRQKTILRLFRDIDAIDAMPPALAIGYIRDVVGYARFLKTETDGEGYAAACALLEALRDEAAAFTDTGGFLAHVEALQARARSDRKETPDKPEEAAGVRIMTMHGAKGLEFNTVYLPFLNEGVMPSYRACTQEAREEERRLLYVAMTRARHKLILSCSLKNNEKRLIPSTFLSFPVKYSENLPI